MQSVFVLLYAIYFGGLGKADVDSARENAEPQHKPSKNIACEAVYQREILKIRPLRHKYLAFYTGWPNQDPSYQSLS